MSLETKKTSLPIGHNFQDYLSMGYLYILVLGIVCNLIYYHFFKINIVNHSTVLDVLLSPFSVMSDSIPILIMVLITPILVWTSSSFLSKKAQKKQSNPDKAVSQEEFEKKITSLEGFKLSIPILFIFSALVGFSIGKGIKMSDMIKKNEHKANYVITFDDNNQDSIRLIGQNSQYIFYALSGKTEITSSPIQGNIKRIQKIKKQ